MTALLLAQVGAETRTRLRSTGTLLAVLAVLAASYAWMPAPSPYAASLTWGGDDGAVITGVYNSAYVGTASALLASTLLPFVGFYLVAGSVARDRASGVGAILAATPLSSLAYLAGKAAAHTVYLLAVAATSIASGVVVLLRFGEGRLEPLPLLVPWLLIVPPSLLVTASLAVLFDVTPGLRSRGGLVLWFFVWSLGLLLVPMWRFETRGTGMPLFDPTGFAWFASVMKETTGQTIRNLSIGNISKTPMTRIVWDGLALSPLTVAARLANALWALVPLGLALLAFDRFDPSKRGGRLLALRRARAAARRDEAGPSAAGAIAQAPVTFRPLAPVPTRFAPFTPFLAEARLVWDSAPFLRWPLLAAALVAGLPGDAAHAGAAAFLILLAPVVSEAAAREALSGTEPLVFALPALPRSVALWKGGALSLFALALGAPMVVRAAFGSPAGGLAALLGLGFLALWAAASGLLSGGGKLFSATLMVLWYGALNGAAFLDFSGTLSGHPSPARSLGYLLAGAAALALAEVVHRRMKGAGR